MSSLVKNELIKIFKKKSIYVTLLVVFAFVILTNCMYKYFYTSSSSYIYSEDYIKYVKEELATLDPNKQSDESMYIDLKTRLDIYEISEKYTEDWQKQIIQNNMASYINEKNVYTYGMNKDEQKVKEIQSKIDEIISKLDENDWKYFANLELEEANNKLEILEDEEKNTTDKQRLSELKIEIEKAKIDKEVAKIRVEKDIKYGSDYMNEALESYRIYAQNVINYENQEQELKYEEKQELNKSIKKMETSKYVLQTGQDIENGTNLAGILKSFYSEYGLFIIVMIIMVAGTIVSEEFNKGTIKLLLVKPYSRYKILLSKFLTILIMIVFSILVVIGMELLVGGILFGFDSLSIPVVEYNFNTNTLETINVFKYLGIYTLTQLPMIILLSTLAFALSTIFTNSALAITIALLGYMAPSIINMLVIQYKVTFMQYFVTMNWDLSGYLFGNLPAMEGMTMGMSIITCLIYFLIMIIPTFIIFKKKNIKNI